MSLGERISTIRKEKGLSQEAFGNELNVTRQTVSKWELDQAYPEVDKLIEISKKYDVSIEWLLGTRENRHDVNDLSEQQLKAIEDIVKKYIDNKPKEESHKHPSFFKVISIVFMIAIFIWGSKVTESIRNLNTNQDYLSHQMNTTQSNIHNQIDNITDKIETIIENQNKFFEKGIVEIKDYDYQTNIANLYIEVIPKEYKKNLKIKVLIEFSKTKKIIDLEEKEKVFTKNIKMELEDNFTVTAIYVDNTTEKNDIIQKFENVLENTKYRWDGCGFSMSKDYINYNVEFQFKSKEGFIPCDIKYVDTYFLVNDEFIKKERNNVSKVDYKEKAYEIEINKETSEIVSDSLKKSEENVIIKYIHVIHDEFDRVYTVGQLIIDCNFTKDEYESSYDNELKDFNWKEYE